MQLELNYTASGLTLKEAVQDAFQLCASMETCASSLETQAQAPLKFRLVILKKRLADLLSDLGHPLSLNTTKEYIAMLGEITGPSYSGWEDFCPVIAFDIQKAEILKSDVPYSEKADQLRQLLLDAERRNDYTKANQTYISIHETVKEWLDAVKGKSEESSTFETFRTIGKAFFEFHDQQTRMAYFKGAALTDYLNTLSVRCHDYSTVLQLVETFEEKHPNFGVPNNQERLYDQAITAARHLGMVEKQRQLTKKYQNWFLKCSFVGQGGGISDEAISNPDFAFRGIKEDSNDPVEWGSNAIRLMMRWAGHEWDRGLMSVEDCSLLIGPSLGDLPQANLAEYLKNSPVANVSESIFGTHDEPTTTVMYMDRYRKLLDWILIPDRLPSRSARLFALKIFLQSRLYRVREYLRDRCQPSVEEAVALEEETKALTELENLEAAENGNSVDQEDKEKTSAIHTALVKVFAVDAVKSGLINEAELIWRAADCCELITHYHNSGHRLKEYHTICQLIRLTWQRYLLFKTVPPEEVMLLVNEADKVFVKTRNAITALDPPENLVARIQLSQNFSHREHHNFALAGRLQAFETCMTQANNMPIEQFQNLASQSFSAFLYWTFRSKGRGFIDILNLETGVAQALGKTKTDPELESEPQTETSASDKTDIGQAATTGLESKLKATNLSPPEFISPLNETMVTKQQIDEMVQSLPDGVVIVDFLDLRYSPTTSFVAMIYRKGQMNLPTKIPNMSMGKIDKWVEDNLDLEREGQPGQLNDGNALDKVGELSGLLEPLIRTLPKLAIQPDETVIFCPTGSLNRVPIHAIPVDGKPFIERNPVVYCQSLTILHWLWLKFRDRQRTTKVSKTTVLNPMPEFWSDETPVQSTERVADLARKLDADFHHGFNLQNKAIAKAVEGSTLFYHHGHVSYNPESALDSAMILNQKAFKAAKRIIRPKGCEFLTAREFFRIKLCELALAIIIGCGSGIAAISNTDDVLGIPTALFYAGASSVVSTLWSIDDEDGAEFSKQFYAAIWEQKKRSSDTAAPADEGAGIFDRTVDLARAMQTAVVKLREDAERKERLAPYHWAAFTLNGFWILPGHVVPDIR
jgi:CHAT domain-containing protein